MLELQFKIGDFVIPKKGVIPIDSEPGFGKPGQQITTYEPLQIRNVHSKKRQGEKDIFLEFNGVNGRFQADFFDASTKKIAGAPTQKPEQVTVVVPELARVTVMRLAVIEEKDKDPVVVLGLTEEQIRSFQEDETPFMEIELRPEQGPNTLKLLELVAVLADGQSKDVENFLTALLQKGITMGAKRKG